MLKSSFQLGKVHLSRLAQYLERTFWKNFLKKPFHRMEAPWDGRKMTKIDQNWPKSSFQLGGIMPKHVKMCQIMCIWRRAGPKSESWKNFVEKTFYCKPEGIRKPIRFRKSYFELEKFIWADGGFWKELEKVFVHLSRWGQGVNWKNLISGRTVQFNFALNMIFTIIPNAKSLISAPLTKP